MGVILTGIAVGVGGTVVASLLLGELKGWQPKICAWLIDMSSKRLPEEMRVRAEEDWRAVVDELPTPFSKLLYALFLPAASMHLRPVMLPRLGSVIERFRALFIGLLAAFSSWLIAVRFRGTPRILDKISASPQAPRIDGGVAVNFPVMETFEEDESKTVMLWSRYLARNKRYTFRKRFKNRPGGHGGNS